MLINDIYHIDFRDGLKTLKNSSVDLVLTDPPYLLDIADWDNNFDFDQYFSLVGSTFHLAHLIRWEVALIQ